MSLRISGKPLPRGGGASRRYPPSYIHPILPPLHLHSHFVHNCNSAQHFLSHFSRHLKIISAEQDRFPEDSLLYSQESHPTQFYPLSLMSQTVDRTCRAYSLRSVGPCYALHRFTSFRTSGRDALLRKACVAADA